MQQSQLLVVGLGEVLWDLLPSGRQLGGAPANFAFHAQQLGARGVVVSAVGRDALGQEILERLDQAGLDRNHVQILDDRATGTVTVEVDAQGQPRYVIHESVAWDFITWQPTLEELARRVDCVCVGSLAQRGAQSQQTIQRFLAATSPACLRIFDINLRQHYYSLAVIEQTLAQCQVLKLNDEEWPTVAKMLRVDTDLHTGPAQLLAKAKLKLIALTCGSHGSLLISPQGVHKNAGVPVQVVDTVGAGDSFTATLAMGLLRHEPLELVHQRAAEVAAHVCQHPGAMVPHKAWNAK